MTMRDLFSPVEWSILVSLPARVIASAVLVEPATEIASLVEEAAGLTELARGAGERPDCRLVQEVFAACREASDDETPALELSQQGVENLIPETLLLSGQVAELLARTVEPDEAGAFSSWLLDAAESSCAAARTGGILGIGGPRISDAEAQFLAALDSALRGTPSDEPAS
ncbi:MAG: hypothetical protein KF883_07720 [Thermomicrobiales bacterium]|nr:hypothetical protein [Thermomicrobiales bacterium]